MTRALYCAALWLAASTANAAPLPCDRACLEGFLDTYVAAVVAHDPARLTMEREVRFTENGQRLMLGDGLWHTATGAGGYALKLADVERGQAVFMGTIREANTPTILIARLRIAYRKVTDIETLVIRNREAAEHIDEVGTPRSTWSEPVPIGERLPRADLMRIANAYFSGIERNDGKARYPIADDCARFENGQVTAGDPARVSPRAHGQADGRVIGCREQLESGVFYYVTRIRDRRFVLLDPERGLAFAFAFFDNAGGDSRFGTLANGRKVENGPAIPWTWQIAEVFKIERGRIGAVESVISPVPYGMVSGWSDWHDAMSSEPRG